MRPLIPPHFGRTRDWYLRERCHIYSKDYWLFMQRFNSVVIHESLVSADEEPDL